MILWFKRRSKIPPLPWKYLQSLSDDFGFPQGHPTKIHPTNIWQHKTRPSETTSSASLNGPFCRIPRILKSDTKHPHPHESGELITLGGVLCKIKTSSKKSRFTGEGPEGCRSPSGDGQPIFGEPGVPMVVVWFHSEYMGWGWGENLYFCLCSLLITYNCIDSIQVGIYIYIDCWFAVW